ncbi:MAG TPA: hypothetical protein VJ865_08840 [Gemmatimonadaceae bacterium]|nr:hypothetical protein [Gemmatimonadaceae bacterium]
MSARLVYLLAVAAAVGCASTKTNPSVSGQSASVLTAEEMQQAHADATTAYDAIARLRPNWLAAKGVTSGYYNANTQYATVFLDGQPYGDLSTLRNIAAYNVGTMRYYDVTQAGAKFGIRGGASGVIEVQSKAAGQQ